MSNLLTDADNADGFLPLDDAARSGDHVYIKAVWWGGATEIRTFVAAWFDGEFRSLLFGHPDAFGWKPLPAGLAWQEAHRRLASARAEATAVRPSVAARPTPQAVYATAPNGTEVELTEAPRSVLIGLADGASLLERERGWSNYDLHFTTTSSVVVQRRAMETLSAHGFICRNEQGVPGRNGWLYVWDLTDAGRAWVAANVRKAA